MDALLARVHARRLDEHRQVVGDRDPLLGMVRSPSVRVAAMVLTRLVGRSVLVLKIMLGVHLLTYATRRRAGMEAREDADRVNDFGRDPIGEGKEEQVRF